MTQIKLEDAFDVFYGNKFDLNKMRQSAGGVNFVGRSSENLGVTASVEEIPDVKPYEAGLITVALGGTKLLSAFVQARPFYTAQNVAVLRPKHPMKMEEKLYVCLSIRHNRFRYSAFGREANRTIKTLTIPVMASFPGWLREASFSAHAQFAESLAPLKKSVEPPQTVPNVLGNNRVPISSLFDVCYGSNLELNRLDKSKAEVNFVSRTAKNNGVSARVKRLADLEPISGGVLSVAGGGSVLETFLQLEPFYSGRDLYYLKPKNPLSVDELLFYCTCIRANMFRYSYGRQANRTLKDLPVPGPDAIPSWVYGGSAATVTRIEQEIATSEGEKT